MDTPMTIHRTVTMDILPEAQLAIRFKFNPTAMDEITEIKTLTGALITRLIKLRSGAHSFGPIYDQAIEHVVTASMWSVLAATHEKAIAGG